MLTMINHTFAFLLSAIASPVRKRRENPQS
jgi:hypothetical protein